MSLIKIYKSDGFIEFIVGDEQPLLIKDVNITGFETRVSDDSDLNNVKGFISVLSDDDNSVELLVGNPLNDTKIVANVFEDNLSNNIAVNGLYNLESYLLAL